jgi:hypothetical protein
MYTWIRAATATLAGVLTERFEADPGLRTFFDTAAGGTMRVSARTPQAMNDSAQRGLSVWLYRVARDEHLLNHPPRRIAPDRMERRRLPLLLHYLLTPVVAGEDLDEPGLEQAIVGKVLQVFHDSPLLSGARLRDDLVGSGVELGVRFEPMALEDATNVWDALELPYRLCVGYEVSMVLLASEEEASRLSPVRVVHANHGVIAGVEPAP